VTQPEAKRIRIPCPDHTQWQTRYSANRVSDTLLMELTGRISQSRRDLLVTGDSIAANLMPSELLPSTTWLVSPVFGSWVVNSLNGIDVRIAKDPFDIARCHPEPSSLHGAAEGAFENRPVTFSGKHKRGVAVDALHLSQLAYDAIQRSSREATFRSRSWRTTLALPQA